MEQKSFITHLDEYTTDELFEIVDTLTSDNAFSPLTMRFACEFFQSTPDKLGHLQMVTLGVPLSAELARRLSVFAYAKKDEMGL